MARIRDRGRLRLRPARRRRNPELARVEILDAAERVFVEFQPDQVGLKDVAREAGVSHALINHYFGTYAAMVEAVLERRILALREAMVGRLREAGALARPAELLAVLFRALEDPLHVRLTRWMLASERPSSAHAFALRNHGLQLIAHQVASAMSDAKRGSGESDGVPGGASPMGAPSAANRVGSTDPRPTAAMIRTIEMALLAVVAAAYGYAIGKYALAGALGREVSVELDREVHRALALMLETHLRAELGDR